MGYKDLYDRWKNALANERTLQSLPLQGRNPQWFDQMQAIKAQIKDLAAEVRDRVGKEHPEFRYFPQSLPFDEIQRQAKEAPLVYLAGTAHGGFALIVREQSEPQVVNLPRLSETALQERVRKYLITYRQRLGWQSELNALLEWLGEVMMAPLLEALRQAQIWLRDTPLEDMLRYWRGYPDRQVGLAFHRYLTPKVHSLNLRHPYYWAGFACVGLP